ncbi:thiamine diphosphate-binding protein, partial [Aspergillus heteromorphus CBS 117.55]
METDHFSSELVLFHPFHVFLGAEADLSGRKHSNHLAPLPGPDEVLVHLKFSGLCHSSLHTWKDGHEGVGIVAVVGKEVNDIKSGDHVGVQWINATCGVCDADKKSDYLSCPHARITGYSVDGTFGDYCISQARHVVRIPKQYPMDTVAPIICAGTTCFRAVQESGAQAGNIVAVVGPGGGIGSLACQYARARGCRVLAISTGEDSKRMYKEKIGVDFYVDYERSNNVSLEVQTITGGGPDVALLIESTDTLLKEALQYIRSRGTVVVVGLPPGTTVDVELSNLMSRMAHIKAASYGGTREQIEEAIHIFVKDRFYQPSHVLDLHQLPEVLKSIQRYDPKKMSAEEALRYGVQLLGEAIVKIPNTEITSIVQKPVHPPNPQPTFYQKEYNIGTYLAYRIEELGIRDYFVVPGDSNLVLLDNLLRNPNIQMVGCCNELNAGYAADGYARNSATKVAVVVVPYIVGSLSILNAISGACSQKLRVIVLAGCPSTNLLASDKFLHHAPTSSNRDQGLHAYQGVTAASVRLESAETAADVMDDTIVKCLESSLPVYIEVPNDLVSATCVKPSPLKRKLDTSCQPGFIEEALEAITDLWSSSSKPVLLLGSLARRCLSHDQIELLADKLGCAVLCQPDGRCMTECHPQYCGQFWSGMTNAEGERVVMNSDLWLVIGGNWSDLHALLIDINQERHRMISVDKEWVELPGGKCIEPVDISTLVSRLIQSGMDSKSLSVPRPKPVLGAPTLDGPEIPDAPVTIKSAMTGIQKLLKEYDTLICDAGESWFIANHILLPPGADCQMQFPYCSIGWGLPAGLGSQLARTQGRAVIMIGDGGFQMTAQELSTMIRRKANPIVLVFNNLGYKIETSLTVRQTAVHEGPYNYIANWDYTKLATSFSTPAHASSHNPYARKTDEVLEAEPAMFARKIKTQGELAQALQRAEEEPDKLAFLELCTQPDDLTDELQHLGSMVSKTYTEQPTESFDSSTNE